MPVNWAALSDWVRVFTPRLMLSICILSAVFLFSPSPVIERLGLISLIDTNRQWIGLAFVASASLLLGHGAFEFLPKATKTVHFRWRRRRRARSLDDIEKRIIQCYIRNDTHTQRFNVDSGVISGLVAFGFLMIAAHGDPVAGSPFNITDWAYRYFKKHPELIDTPGLGPWNPMDGVP